MKKNRWLLRASALLALALALNGTVSAAAEAGSSADPLVTLSYLNDTYLSAVLSKVDSKIAQRNTALLAQIDQKVAASGGTGSTGGTASVFTVVTLAKGKTLKGGVGCEVLLRIGSAVCVASSSPGLIDETSGGTLSGGAALSANHLYMMSVSDRGVKATSATVKVMVRGSYTVS
ncbi:MAG: hypothetical protein LKJ80_08250 [Oscillibacter sp.]|jgi:hypothetical protein|nr:hypothetical protein [Oscillibacter sp.]